MEKSKEVAALNAANDLMDALNAILPNHEIHFIEDGRHADKFKENTFILFEYTIECWPETIELLNNSNIKYSVHTGDSGLKYIII